MSVQATLIAVRDLKAERLLVVNPPADAGFRDWLSVCSAEVTCVQPFYPHCVFYEGFDVLSRLEDVASDFDTAIVFFPKNKIEGQYALGCVLERLQDHGSLIVSAGNKEGGNRLKKMMQAMELDRIFETSKDKAKAISGVKTGLSAAPASWMQDGAQMVAARHGMVSQAGIYGWDKIDQGSALLLEHLPDDLSGIGADFGCGYGLLARHVLEHNDAVERFYFADADARAVDCTTQNLSSFSDKITPLWCDLTSVQPDLKDLDFIVMNPPFHEGRKTDIGIGQGFIQTARRSLKSGGALYMVANAHLPYEAVLNLVFSDVEKLHEGSGFKIYKAIA